MARVWQRLASVSVAAGLVLLLSQCKGLKPTPGAPCVTNGKYQCSDPASALLCQSGKYVTLPCRGPRGCSGFGASSMCDDDLAQEGDACMQTLNDNYACAVDHTKEFICKAGKFTAVRTCKGPKKCTVSGDTINCDDSMADVGDVCVVDPGDANYGCSPDKKNEVVCDGPTSKFTVAQACRGQRGCNIENDKVYCDYTVARVGEKCRHPDTHACSEDATAKLKCMPNFQWAAAQACKHGCKVKPGVIDCE
jgi:hypothetical protein